MPVTVHWSIPEGFAPVTTPEELSVLADWFEDQGDAVVPLPGIDFLKEWRGDEAFLELLSTENLRDVAREWGVDCRAEKWTAVLEHLVAHLGQKSRCLRMILGGVTPVSLH